jgi:hypothetical protein
MIPNYYFVLLRERDLVPEPSFETDWSGRSQHAKFSHDERDCFPLRVEKVLEKHGVCWIAAYLSNRFTNQKSNHLTGILG